MLLILKIKSLEELNINDLENGKKVTVKGKAQKLCFRDDYIEELEKKASKYDEMIEESKKVKMRSFSDICSTGYIGIEVKPRKSL